MCDIFKKLLTVIPRSFTPVLDLCVDNSLLPYKGELNTTQYTIKEF